MQAIILAAGMGRRLKELTTNNTKCMVKVNGITLIERMLRQIDARSFSRIIIVDGYEGEKLREFVDSLNINTPIIFVRNDVYSKTNNIFSLYLARDYLCEEETILFESDLIFEDCILDLVMNDSNENIALVDKYESWMAGTCIKLSEENDIIDFVNSKRFSFDDINEYYKTVNIYKFSKEFSIHYYVPFLEAYQEALGRNEYYEQVLRVITMLDTSQVKAVKLNGQKWYEIDDIQDLNIAESIFVEDDDQKVSLLNARYGGYWRYPKLLDFCYLVNPYFPPQKLKDELRASFDTLLTEYPSGMYVNSLLAGKNFNVHRDNIIVGNGAAELIKSLMERLSGKIGFIRPTFEEYPNRYDIKKSICFMPDNTDYSYDADDIINFFNDKEIDAIVIVNPDNPSGNYIRKNDLLRLVSWSKQKGVKIVINESFVDFSDELDCTLIEQPILEQNPHLFVMKSISKSYGVPGLRLGVLASGDKETISWMKKDVSIWNINSFAEFYMQIEEKYKDDYLNALVKFRNERERFKDQLDRIDGIRVIASQANYFMAEVIGMSSAELLKELLVKYDILIKDLSSKMNGKSYIRISIRDEKDNDALVSAMKEELNRG